MVFTNSGELWSCPAAGQFTRKLLNLTFGRNRGIECSVRYMIAFVVSLLGLKEGGGRCMSLTRGPWSAPSHATPTAGEW